MARCSACGDSEFRVHWINCADSPNKAAACVVISVQVKTIILATFLSVLLFDWLGVILFAGTSGHDEFRSFQSGCTSLLLVVTTVRLPQVLLRGYTVHEVAVLFIVVFYLLTAVLLGLFAAAFYTGYRDGDLQVISDARVELTRTLRHLAIEPLPSTGAAAYLSSV